MLKDHSPRRWALDHSIFLFLHFLWMSVLFQELIYLMGACVHFQGAGLSSPKAANLSRLQCQAVRLLSLLLFNHIWDKLSLVRRAVCPRHKSSSKKQGASLGRVRHLENKGREVQNWVVLCCKCDFPHQWSECKSLRAGYLKNRMNSQNTAEPSRVSQTFLQFMQGETGDKRNVLTLADDVVLFILM